MTTIYDQPQKILPTLIFWLKVSRPGLWFATLWLYLLPTSQMEGIWTSIPFWIGFVYVTFPLNFLVYGWNDMVDRETDALNPRKDSFWFGAKGTVAQLENLWQPMLILHAVYGSLLFYLVGWKMLVLLLTFVLINGAYNLPKNGLRSRPPLELLCQVGYIMTALFSVYLNETAPLPWQTYLYLLLFAWQSHLIGEVMDIIPDKAAGRRTTATILGVHQTKLLIIGIVLVEVLMLFFVFKDFIFGGMLSLGLIWLLLDLFFIYKSQTYSVNQMKFFGAMSNVVAIASMLYVWYSGCLIGVIE